MEKSKIQNAIPTTAKLKVKIGYMDEGQANTTINETICRDLS